MVKKIMISVDEDVLNRVEECANDMGLNRSAFFTMCASEFINARTALPKAREELTASFNELLDALNDKFKK